MGVLIQKAHGVGGAVFAAPTQPGNTVLAVIGAPVGSGVNLYVGHLNGVQSYGDDQHNWYNGGGVLAGSTGGLQTDMWYIVTTTEFVTIMPPTPGIQTVYMAPENSAHFLWIYELNCNAVMSGGYQLFGVDIQDLEHGSGDPPTGYDAGAVGNSYNPPATVGDFVATIVGIDSGSILTGPPGWTEDTPQGAFRVWYTFAPNGDHTIPVFTSSGVSAWCLSTTGMSTGVPDTPPGPGHIIITKATVPSGSLGSFVLTPSWGAPFTLTDGQSHDSGPLTAGTYSVVETPFTGWTISTSSNPAAIVVTDGVTVTVVFTNTQPGGPGAFTPGVVVPWPISIEDHLLTINDLDGDADLADLIFNVQDRSALITADFPGFVFEGKRMRLLAGFDGMDRADFVTLFTGRVDSIESANANMEYVFTCPDVRQELTRTIYTVADDGFPTDSSHVRTLNGNPLDILIAALENEVGLAPSDINLTKILAYRDYVYNGVQFEFKITSPPVAKDFIANELMKPLAAYIWPNNLGQVSVNFYYPLSPLPVFDFNRDNLVEIPEAGPADLINEVSVRLDYDSSDSPKTEIVREDAASVAKFGLYGNHIIEAKGLRSGLQGAFLGALAAWLIFLRYSFKQLMFGSSNSGNGNANPINALWSACLVEPGDISTLTHPQVPDRNAGVMGVTGKTFVVMDRQWQFFPCLTQLKLLETDLSKFKQYLIAPNGEPDYTATTSGDRAALMFLCNDSDQYSNGDPGNTLA